MKVWRDVSVGIVRSLVGCGLRSTIVINRAELTYRYTNFFEGCLPRTAGCVIDIIVALIMIFLVIPSTGLIVTAATFVSLMLSYHLACRQKVVDVKVQEERERVNHAIENNQMDEVEHGYHELKKLYVRESDINAINWSTTDIIEIICKVLIIFALAKQGHSVGTIMATVSYGLRLFQKTGVLTYTFMEIKELEVANNLTGNTI